MTDQSKHKEEQVDTLTPPTFARSGIVKGVNQAIKDNDWLGTFNLWIIRTEPEPSIVYQQRGPNSAWEPNKLDVSAGGHYEAGETIHDGMREVEEELGRSYKEDQLTYLGRKLNVSPDTNGYMRHTVVDIFFAIDNSPLDSFTLQKEEVYAICACPIEKLIRAHTQKFSFETLGLKNDGREINLTVSADSFPYNWDKYHMKIALLANRYLKDEKHLIY